jgi:hypothetical protein
VSASFSLPENFNNAKRSQSDLAPSEIADFIERVLLWPPPERRVAISLVEAELGLHPGELWDVAALLLAGEVAL